jgi:hypothetical protein
MTNNKLNTYSFVYRTPKDFKNDFIKVKARNKVEAKDLLLKELYKINERFVDVKKFNKAFLKEFKESKLNIKKKILEE